jgi:hypothetical protein
VHEIFGKLWMKFKGQKGRLRMRFERAIFQFKFAKYVCVSNYTKNSLRTHFGLPDEKLRTVYNGIDYDLRRRENFQSEKIKKIRKEL